MKDLCHEVPSTEQAIFMGGWFQLRCSLRRREERHFASQTVSVQLSAPSSQSQLLAVLWHHRCAFGLQATIPGALSDICLSTRLPENKYKSHSRASLTYSSSNRHFKG